MFYCSNFTKDFFCVTYFKFKLGSKPSHDDIVEEVQKYRERYEAADHEVKRLTKVNKKLKLKM